MSDALFTPPPLATVVAFLTILLGVQGLLLFAVHRSAPDPARARRRVALTGLAFVLVAGAATLAAESGLMARPGPPPPPMVFFAVCNLSALALALTAPGRALALAVTPAFWLVLQGFRVPLEVVLHAWHDAGTIPVQMTWSGENLDIFAGLAALVLGGLWWRRPTARWAGWLGHALGLLLLMNVARVAVGSIPGPLRVFEGPPLLLPFHAPFLWIVPFAVSAALFSHAVGLRALLIRPVATPDGRGIG